MSVIKLAELGKKETTVEHLIGQRIYRVLENGASERYPRWIEAIDSASLLVVSARGTLDIVPIEDVRMGRHVIRVWNNDRLMDHRL